MIFAIDHQLSNNRVIEIINRTKHRRELLAYFFSSYNFYLPDNSTLIFNEEYVYHRKEFIYMNSQKNIDIEFSKPDYQNDVKYKLDYQIKKIGDEKHACISLNNDIFYYHYRDRTWQEGNKWEPDPTPSDLDIVFSKEDHIKYFDDIIGLSEKELWGRWTDGPNTKIMFKTKSNAKSVSFLLKAFVTPQLPVQTAEVFINNQPAGSIHISNNESQPRKFIFPLPASQDNSYVMEFKIKIQ